MRSDKLVQVLKPYVATAASAVATTVVTSAVGSTLAVAGVPLAPIVSAGVAAGFMYSLRQEGPRVLEAIENLPPHLHTTNALVGESIHIENHAVLPVLHTAVLPYLDNYFEIVEAREQQRVRRHLDSATAPTTLRPPVSANINIPASSTRSSVHTSTHTPTRRHVPRPVAAHSSANTRRHSHTHTSTPTSTSAHAHTPNGRTHSQLASGHNGATSGHNQSTPNHNQSTGTTQRSSMPTPSSIPQPLPAVHSYQGRAHDPNHDPMLDSLLEESLFERTGATSTTTSTATSTAPTAASTSIRGMSDSDSSSGLEDSLIHTLSTAEAATHLTFRPLTVPTLRMGSHHP